MSNPIDQALESLRFSLQRDLERRLDRMCDSVGVDPREAWRWPRIAEDEARTGEPSPVSATASEGRWA